MPVISVTISRNLLLRGRRFQFNKSDRIKPILIIIPIQALPARRTGNYMVEVYRQSRKINHLDLIYDTVFKMHIDPAIVGISLRQCKFRGLFPPFQATGQSRSAGNARRSHDPPKPAHSQGIFQSIRAPKPMSE